MRSPGVTQRVVAVLAISLLLSLPSPAQQHGHEPTQDTGTVKLDTDLVSLSVTVADQNGKAVLGLKREDFKVYENGIEQIISFFSADEAPACWGLVLDRSGSMTAMMRDVYQAAIHVMDEGTEQDEMFIVTFNDQPEIVCEFSSDRHKWENSLLGLRAGGTTALYDAVAFALDHIQQAKHQKKVLVVITDGEDNSSQLKFRQLIDQVEERNVLIYTVGMFEPMERSLFDFGGGRTQGELEKLAEATGARAHFPTNVERCREAMKEIAGEVSQQYSLGYYPSNTARDGKWRKIKVVATRQGEKDTRYVARARTGYYAPRGDEMR
ncbi:MAG: VWA domain-containing protein [Acidobacteria bacterium]|nr:VWA domain-containing protein [Acidobacteriota bacterium]